MMMNFLINTLEKNARAGADARSMKTGTAEAKIGDDTVKCVVRWTRVNPPSGVVRETLRTDWYLNDKRVSASKIAQL
jgi:hypothetical protein